MIEYRCRVGDIGRLHMQFREGGNCWGIHRVLDPKGSLPQSAIKLDPSPPPFENEILVSITDLQIDAASFCQLKRTFGEESIKTQIIQIIREYGKMHNPATNSGGVFLGKISAIGPKHPLKNKLKVGDRVVSLVSLTLTPLSVEKITKVDTKKERVSLGGSAVIFETGLVSKMPDDLPEGVVLAALDVCGAPAQVKRCVREGNKVLILGLGKAGRSMACQAEMIGAQVFGIDASSDSIEWCRKNLSGHFAVVDALNTVAVHDWVFKETKGALVDVTLHATPVENTETAAIVSCRDGGQALFFGMRTSFQRVVLATEGMGKDVMLLMGNGYVPGHSELMLNLLRQHQPLRRWFGEKYG